MKRQTRLSEQQEHMVEQRLRQQTPLEFEGSDQLLRYDAAQVAVPPELAQRVRESAAKIRPPAARPWWKNLFRG